MKPRCSDMLRQQALEKDEKSRANITFDNCMLLILVNGSILKKFLDETANMSADERAERLESNKVSKLFEI